LAGGLADGVRLSSIASFDGCVEVLVPNLECIAKAWKDPYYKEVVAPDEAKFIDMSRIVQTVGYEEVFIEDGKVKGCACC